MTNTANRTSHRDARSLLGDLYHVAVAAAEPGAALTAALARGETAAPTRPVHLLALGKAAEPMALAAVRHLERVGGTIAGGVLVSPSATTAPHPALRAEPGDHPEPGARSFAAAEALDRAVRAVEPAHEAWVLLSGGTTSLVGAPGAGLSGADLTQLYAVLLRSGLDIAQMNTVRKRFTRWSGGRLARALAPARVRVFVVSDVIGDDLAAIASGPCVPDPATAADVRELLVASGLWDRIPAPCRQLVEATLTGGVAETPKPGDAAFERVSTELIASNRLALEAVARQAAGLGLAPEVVPAPLAGEASEVGASVAATLTSYNFHKQAQVPVSDGLVIWGGETTVTFGSGAAGLGGRSQELALAAARALAGTTRITVLAGGTDGRDGPTDAAGAIVDGGTWAAITAAGVDPADALARHDSHPALDAVGALLRPGLTGTNVMDIVLGLVEAPRD